MKTAAQRVSLGKLESLSALAWWPYVRSLQTMPADLRSQFEQWLGTRVQYLAGVLAEERVSQKASIDTRTVSLTHFDITSTFRGSHIEDSLPQGKIPFRD